MNSISSALTPPPARHLANPDAPADVRLELGSVAAEDRMAARPTSFRPAALCLAQGLAGAGSIVAGFSLRAQSTWQGEPYHYLAWGVGATATALTLGTTAILTAARLGVSGERNTAAGVSLLMAAAGSVLLQQGLDQQAQAQTGVGAAVLGASVLHQLYHIDRLALLGQARWGAVPLLPIKNIWTDKQAAAALAAFGIAAGAAGLTAALVSRAQGNEAGRVAGFGIVGLGALCLIGSMFLHTRPTS